MTNPMIKKSALAVCWLMALGIFLAQPIFAQQKEESSSDANSDSKPEMQAEAGETNETAAASAEQGSDSIRWGPPLISIGRDAVLKEGQTAEAVVIIGGSGKVHGKVREAAVVIGGDLDVTGQIGDAAVAVFGDINARQGAKIQGDAVSVGGRIDVDEGAKVGGMVEPWPFPYMRWLGKYFTHCVLLMRPLAPEVGWVWVIAGIWFLFYVLIAALFPAPIEACVNELRRRPASTFFMGILAKILFPLAFLILAVTGIGLIVIPFLFAALVLGAIIGRIALTEWIGFKLGRNFKHPLEKPLFALLLGGLIIAILYIVPVVGFFTMLIVSVWGLGCAVTAAFGGLRREAPVKPVSTPVSTLTPAMAVAGATAGLGGTGYDQFAPQPYAVPGTPPTSGPASSPAPGVAPLTQPPAMPEVLSFPRASFWERLAAGFLDLVLVGIISGFIHVMPFSLIIGLAYFAGMWAWRGTTVGGIVLGLKVVRVDGQSLSFPVALVRALGAGFSIVVLFLGFIWIAWDSEKQGWHDRIAGTVVLRLPRGTPLLCI